MGYSSRMPNGKHEHVKTYDLKQLKKDILNNDLFGFVQVDIETPEELKKSLVRCEQYLRMQKINLKISGNICRITTLKIMFHLIKVIN
jgi:hypothetical protein